MSSRPMTFLGIALATVLCCTAAPARAATVTFARGQSRADSQFTILPAQPQAGDTISFFDPLDRRQFDNWFVAIGRSGTPALSIDPAERTIDVVFGPDRANNFPAHVDPHSGLRGDFGQLSAGVWTYRSNETHTFTVAVPEPAGATLLLAAGGAGLLVLRRRRA